jgi:hypothetical protein
VLTNERNSLAGEISNNSLDNNNGDLTNQPSSSKGSSILTNKHFSAGSNSNNNLDNNNNNDENNDDNNDKNSSKKKSNKTKPLLDSKLPAYNLRPSNTRRK